MTAALKQQISNLGLDPESLGEKYRIEPDTRLRMRLVGNTGKLIHARPV